MVAENGRCVAAVGVRIRKIGDERSRRRIQAHVVGVFFRGRCRRLRGAERLHKATVGAWPAAAPRNAPTESDGRWNISYLARAAPKLDAKLTLELYRFFQRLVVITRDDGVYCNREPVRTNYKGPVWIRLRFVGSVT
jgi:hypothetical protein